MGLNKKIKTQLGKMPKYKIQQEAFDNLNLAKSRAFGRDRDVQMQEENIESDVATGVGQARDVTDSSSALLATIAQLDSNKNNALRGLTQDEASLRNQKTSELYAANDAMIDEKDKAWNQNVLEPWSAKLKNLQAKKANRQQMLSSITGGLLSAAGGAMAGGLGARKSNTPTYDLGTEAGWNG